MPLLLLQALGDAAHDPVDIGDVDDLSATLTDGSLDGLIVGAPTWNTGGRGGEDDQKLHCCDGNCCVKRATFSV